MLHLRLLRFASILAAFALLFALAACAGRSVPAPPRPPQAPSAAPKFPPAIPGPIRQEALPPPATGQIKVGVLLPLSGPNAELGKAMDRSDQSHSTREQAMLKSIFRSHSRELVDTAVRPHTIRRNWAIASVYDTSLFDTRITVLGIGGSFIPLRGIDEALLRLGRLTF